MKKLQAYCILDGGGVKGAALVGALKQASDFEIDFIGYGGTSAGAIVAFLSAIGLTPAELRRHIVEQPFTEFLEDEGRPMLAFRRFCTAADEAFGSKWAIGKWWKTHWLLWDYRHLLHGLATRYGVDGSTRLEAFLSDRLKERIDAALPGQLLTVLRDKDATTVTFEDLRSAGCLPLKVVASDIETHQAVVYDAQNFPQKPVIAAVLESAAYPFGFKPRSHDSKHIVDGGLVSNLAAALFRNESDGARVPVIAIDLVTKPTKGPDTLGRFVANLMTTALEASDTLMASQQRNFYRVPVVIDPPVHALKFDMDPQVDGKRLYDAGVQAMSDAYTYRLKSLVDIEEVKPRIEAIYCSAEHVNPILEVIAKTLSPDNTAGHVRANIMLPLPDGRRMVIYQFNMDGMSDVDLILDRDGGASGRTFTTGESQIVDLDEARRNPGQWNMSDAQQKKIPMSVRTMISIPIRDTSPLEANQKDVDRRTLPILGTLNVDSSQPISDISWAIDAPQGSGQFEVATEVLAFLQVWAGVLGTLLA